MVDRATKGSIDWLASYPKSGNTWMRMLLANYFNEKEETPDINGPGIVSGIASSRKLFDEFLGLDSSDLTADEIDTLRPSLYEAMTLEKPDRQWLKVHDAQRKIADGRQLFPSVLSGVVIYLIRNPLDVAVSLAFHDGHEDMEKATRKICNSKTILANQRAKQLPQFVGDWSNHVKSWVDQQDMEIMIVRYEDLLVDTAAQLARVIAFARQEEAIDKARIDCAVENTAFEKLKEAEEKEGFRERPTKSEAFFRKGKAGDWRNHLSSDQVSRIRDCHHGVMHRFGYLD